LLSKFLLIASEFDAMEFRAFPYHTKRAYEGLIKAFILTARPWWLMFGACNVI
jgi:hypothetical protein